MVKIYVFRLRFPVPLLTYPMRYFLQQSWRMQYCSDTLVSSSNPSALQGKLAKHAGPGTSMSGQDPQNGLGAQVSPALVPLYILTLGTEVCSSKCCFLAASLPQQEQAAWLMHTTAHSHSCLLASLPF